MKNILKKELIKAANTGHCGYNDKGTWWNIYELPWFTGEKYFDICQKETNQNCDLTIRNNDIKTAIFFLSQKNRSAS